MTIGLRPQEKAEFIAFLASAGALQFGDFSTKSGRKTPYFINTGRFDDGLKIATLGGWYARAISTLQPESKGSAPVDTIFGPAYKGIPLAVATASALSQRFSCPVGYTFNRKEAKTHGDGGATVGYILRSGLRVALVEDVITAGTTMREVLPMLQAQQVNVVGVFVAVDRMERGKDQNATVSAVDEVRNEFSIPVYPLITLLDVIEHVRASSKLQDLLPAIETYRAQYGV